MSDVVYRSEVRIERERGPVRLAWLPSEAEPVRFGVHGAISSHYGIRPGVFEEHATTIDYLVAAAAGWLTGTFGGALAARQIKMERLTGHAVGEVELDQQVLVLKRIHVEYELAAPGADRETIVRVHSVHHQGCPIYRSIEQSIEITTEVRIV